MKSSTLTKILNKIYRVSRGVFLGEVVIFVLIGKYISNHTGWFLSGSIILYGSGVIACVSLFGTPGIYCRKVGYSRDLIFFLFGLLG